jgi:signal transduction histidine kinase
MSQGRSAKQWGPCTGAGRMSHGLARTGRATGDLGITISLIKPIKPTELRQAIVRTLEHERQNRRQDPLSVMEHHVRITIADTGVGIARKNLPRVKEPCFTTKPQGKGIRLGSAIYQHIMQEHQGTLEITSDDLDQGMVVHITLLATIDQTGLFCGGLNEQ